MKTTIAIVEDNADVGEGLRRLIDDSPDFTCVCLCRTAESALRRLPLLAPAIIIQDIQLGGMSGIDCVTLLRRQLPHVQILMFTVCDDPDRIIGAVQAGANGYLLKSTPPARILSALRELLAGEAPVSGRVGRTMIERLRRDATPSTPASDALTYREREVMELLAAGLSSKEIARRLSISSATVNVHLKHSYEKLGARTRVDAAMKFLGRPVSHSRTPFGALEQTV